MMAGFLVLATMTRVFSSLRIAWLTRNHPANAFVLHPRTRHAQSQQNLARLLQMMSGNLGETDAARLRLLMTDRDFTPEGTRDLRFGAGQWKVSSSHHDPGWVLSFVQIMTC